MDQLRLFDCPCGSTLVLKRIKRGGIEQTFYSCTRYPECDYTMRAKRDGSPIGTPADKALRKFRAAARIASDKLYRVQEDGAFVMSRHVAFNLLKASIGMPEEDHFDIEVLDAEQCEGVCAAVETYLKKEEERKRAEG